MCDERLNFDNISSLNANNSLHNFSQIIQNFDKINIKEVEPTTKNINKSIFEEDLTIVVDELVNIIFKGLNEGKDKEIIENHVLNYIYNQKIILQEIYNWILNNQNNSNSIYLLGYFNYHGIEVDVNKQKALELCQKASNLGNITAELNLIGMYISRSVDNTNYSNHNLAFKLSKKLAKKEIPNAINKLGYCYNFGIGTDYNGQKAFESYQKAADLGSSAAIGNLGWCYDSGTGTVINKKKAFELYQKSADLGNFYGISNLGFCYEKGIGTNVNKQKAFDMYLKAAKLGYKTAQYHLARMYEEEDNIDQAIYWYNKSSQQGYKKAQNKLLELLTTK